MVPLDEGDRVAGIFVYRHLFAGTTEGAVARPAFRKSLLPIISLLFCDWNHHGKTQSSCQTIGVYLHTRYSPVWQWADANLRSPRPCMTLHPVSCEPVIEGLFLELHGAVNATHYSHVIENLTCAWSTPGFISVARPST